MNLFQMTDSNSICLNVVTICLQGDIEGSIRAFEDGSTNVEYYFVDMDIMCLHELGFMYALKMDWMAACRTFSNLAEDNSWIRPYHYFMATGNTDIVKQSLNRKPSKESFCQQGVKFGIP